LASIVSRMMIMESVLVVIAGQALLRLGFFLHVERANMFKKLLITG